MSTTNRSTVLRCVLLVICGALFQWLLCSFWFWLFVGNFVVGSFNDIWGICAIGANLPVACLLQSEWWRNRIDLALLVSLVFQIIFGLFSLVVVIGIGC